MARFFVTIFRPLASFGSGSSSVCFATRTPRFSSLMKRIMAYSTYESGAPNSMDFRMYFRKYYKVWKSCSLLLCQPPRKCLREAKFASLIAICNLMEKKCTCMHELALIVMSSKLCRSLLKDIADIARGLLRKYRYFDSFRDLLPCAIQFDQFSSIIIRRKRGNATLESDIYLICPSDLNVCVRVRHDLWSQWNQFHVTVREWVAGRGRAQFVKKKTEQIRTWLSKPIII